MLVLIVDSKGHMASLELVKIVLQQKTLCVVLDAVGGGLRRKSFAVRIPDSLWKPGQPIGVSHVVKVGSYERTVKVLVLSDVQESELQHLQSNSFVCDWVGWTATPSFNLHVRRFADLSSQERAGLRRRLAHFEPDESDGKRPRVEPAPPPVKRRAPAPAPAGQASSSTDGVEFVDEKTWEERDRELRSKAVDLTGD